MAATDTDVINLGLVELGHSVISDYTTEPGEIGRTLRAIYTMIRDELISEYPWNFAMKRVSLAAGATAPDGGYFSAAFPLPDDYLTLRQVGVSLDDRIEYQVELVADVRSIVCNEGAPLPIRYTAKITDPSLFHPMFARALGARVVAACGVKVRGDLEAGQAGLSGFDYWIQKAKQTDAIEQSPAVVELDDWETARFTE